MFASLLQWSFISWKISPRNFTLKAGKSLAGTREVIKPVASKLVDYVRAVTICFFVLSQLKTLVGY
jgi:hypothetical protein